MKRKKNKECYYNSSDILFRALLKPGKPSVKGDENKNNLLLLKEMRAGSDFITLMKELKKDGYIVF